MSFTEGLFVTGTSQPMDTCLTALAVLACSGQGEGMTLEEQKTKLAAARAKAQGALGSAPSGETRLGSSWGSRGVRGVPLGSDREGACYWRLKAADAFGGGALMCSRAYVVMSGFTNPCNLLSGLGSQM